MDNMNNQQNNNGGRIDNNQQNSIYSDQLNMLSQSAILNSAVPPIADEGLFTTVLPTLEQDIPKVVKPPVNSVKPDLTSPILPTLDQDIPKVVEPPVNSVKPDLTSPILPTLEQDILKTEEPPVNNVQPDLTFPILPTLEQDILKAEEPPVNNAQPDLTSPILPTLEQDILKAEEPPVNNVQPDLTSPILPTLDQDIPKVVEPPVNSVKPDLTSPILPSMDQDTPKVVEPSVNNAQPDLTLSVPPQAGQQKNVVGSTPVTNNVQRELTNSNLTNIVSTSKTDANNLKTIIFSLIAFVVVGVATYFGLTYMNGINVNNSSTNEHKNNNTTTDDISYNGFNFTKLADFTYEIDNEMLDIYNDDYMIKLSIVEYAFELIKNEYESLKESLENNGYIVENGKVQTVSENEIITYEVSRNGVSGLYFLIATPNSSYTFEGIILNKSYTINYDDLNEIVKIVNNSIHVGDYDNYSKDFNLNVEIGTDTTTNNSADEN